MKRSILVMIFTMTFLISGMVFADNGEWTAGSKQQEASPLSGTWKSLISGNIDAMKTINAMASSAKLDKIRQKLRLITPYIQEIKSNRETISALQKEVKAKSGTLRTRLKELSGKESSVAPEQLTVLKEHLDFVKPRLANIKTSLGQLRDEETQLKQARENDDYQATSEALQQVLKIQKSRIKELKDLSERLNQINKLLKSIE